MHFVSPLVYGRGGVKFVGIVVVENLGVRSSYSVGTKIWLEVRKFWSLVGSLPFNF